MKTKILKIITFVTLIMLITGCNQQINGNVIRESSITFANELFPNEVAKLPELNLDTIENFEDYKKFADSLNDLIQILDNQVEYDIDPIPVTRDAYSKASKIITEYTPLINNYNEVVKSTKLYVDNKNEKNKEDFYIATARFGFETTLIVWTVFYSAAFETVGIVYRSVGLNTMALKHPIIVKTLLSNAHWFIRNTLVETASQTATEVFNKSLKEYKEFGGIEGIKEKTSNSWNNIKKN